MITLHDNNGNEILSNSQVKIVSGQVANPDRVYSIANFEYTKSQIQDYLAFHGFDTDNFDDRDCSIRDKFQVFLSDGHIIFTVSLIDIEVVVDKETCPFDDGLKLMGDGSKDGSIEFYREGDKLGVYFSVDGGSGVHVEGETPAEVAKNLAGYIESAFYVPRYEDEEGDE